MSERGPHAGNAPTSRWLSKAMKIVDGLRSRVGASRRQFAVFALLILVASALWARPGAMLLWNRLRIITGMPRMAIANEDPELLAQGDEAPPEALDAGRWVRLDDSLRRDPFASFAAGAAADVRSDEPGSNPSGSTPEKTVEWLGSVASLLRLTGTAKGLGTAVLDGRVRALGKTFEAHGAAFRLTEVRSGAVVLEVRVIGDDAGAFFLLDRSEAVLTQGP